MASINFTNHTCVGKATISNDERGIAVAKINDCDRKGKKSITTVYFAMQNSMYEY